ncbi:hypothetical protein RV11_GL001997 [Enterococcus phoeniculicola]|jgi:hypothetical protein|uniref:Uncharacterized protein n=1 Tax=Enterococcus phoeniculicola ATCC BAA-412 TaxID=1158610 RepID=R3W4J8_9ENTE|nr:hypothetical protein [Enterococcus phoeniculicola]EOL42446.1 hypothetical protein UC3_02798 [Enterococcus phoeniculicola ATCC BAA-412]EOT79275.1 hypothetical protein I589_00783 [Enterococcus phoeniculicola ATCC BAA-412]OJG73187.1 hypothetical protein RV11_GL001997 [Enterococcus phoeniculicola]
MLVKFLVGMIVFTYGTNFLVYLYLKNQKKVGILEKLSIYFGINMSVMLADGVLLFFGKLLEDGILVFE